MVIYNTLIPFKGYKAINLFGFIFVRKECNFNDIDLNHERIHSAQMKELAYIIFYLWYLFEWLYLLIKYGNSHTAYRNISFEKEAYSNEENLDYLKTRKHYAQLHSVS